MMCGGDIAMTDEEPDYGAPPYLTMPDGTSDEQMAWLRARIQEGLVSGRGSLADDALFERIKRRGLARLKASQRAA